MFDFLKTNKPKDAKAIRSVILQHIKEQMQKMDGGEGKNIRGLTLYCNCQPEDRHAYEAALYTDDENRFKEEEVQRIADDYAIALPPDWTLQVEFVDTLPPDAIHMQDVDAALFVTTNKNRVVPKDVEAYLVVLNGQTEQPFYKLTSDRKKLNIGRESKVQTADGFYRKNDVAFPDNSNHESNRSVSRQHAHIEWNEVNGCFYLFADEGGVPPQNKVKVRTKDGVQIKLQTMEIGHKLQEGDQAIIGESAVIEFTYIQPL